MWITVGGRKKNGKKQQKQKLEKFRHLMKSACQGVFKDEPPDAATSHEMSQTYSQYMYIAKIRARKKHWRNRKPLKKLKKKKKKRNKRKLFFLIFSCLGDAAPAPLAA